MTIPAHITELARRTDQAREDLAAGRIDTATYVEISDRFSTAVDKWKASVTGDDDVLDFQEELLQTLRCGFHRIAQKQDRIYGLLEAIHTAQVAQMDTDELRDAMDIIQKTNDKKICDHISQMED